MKSESVKHTPGPWTAGFEDETQPCSIRGNGRVVAWIDFWHDFHNDKPRQIAREQQKRNALIIAAAPELLEACRMALVQVRQDNDERKAEHRLTEWQIKSAISKAEGNL